MRRFLLVTIISCLTLPLLGQNKRPFTFEDMMALKRIGDFAVSPDGKWVTFSAVDVDVAANTKTPHIWIVPAAGGEERELIPSQDGDRPRWAPDGKQFAFLSNKEGGSQIWIADFDGAAGNVTAVHKLTSIATEADGELWSPDGKNLLFKSDVYPECANEACNKNKLEEVAKSKVKALIFTHLLYRHWNAYREGKRTHLLIVSAEGGPARDLTPGEYDSPEFSLGGQDDYAFSPDGQEICYTSNHDPEPAISTNNDLWIVSINGGQAKNITAENKASDSTPLYSPDGKYIAYRAQQRPGYESDRFRLMLYDRQTGEKKNLTENFDRWVGSIAWSPRSSSIYFTAENAGESWIYQRMLDGSTWKKTHGYHPDSDVLEVLRGFNDDLAVSASSQELLFTRMSLERPTEIYRLPIDSCFYAPSICDRPGSPDFPLSRESSPAVTHMNDNVLSQISMMPIEPFWFEGAKGDKVEGFLVKPPNFDTNKKYPLKFIVHGGPEVPIGDEWSYRWNAELFAASGYVVIEINFHGSPGYGQKFVDSINGDWGGAPFEDLMKGLDYAEQHYPFIDKNRECALGASYGGYMMNWILGHSDRFKCIVTHDGMFNSTSAWGTTEELWFNDWEFQGTPYTNRAMYDKWSPHMSATNFKTPTLVIHGQRDYRLDVSEGFQLFTTLQRLGVPSKMLYFPDEGHWVLKPRNSELWYKTVNDWVDHWVNQ
jgi:dipeptidyl aminopeptidase/acylaminoacyl peptidase